MKRILTAYLATMAFAQPLLATDGSVYGMGGVGRTSKGESTGKQGGAFGFRQDLTKNTDLDFLYYNEGTPDNNHRDGFATMGWYKKPLTSQLSVQAGAGPYYSMNTTTINGEERNEKKLGALVGLAVLYNIYGTRFYMTSRYTHAAVPGSVDTDTIFVGGGYYFQGDKNEVPENWADPEFDINVMGGNSKTTRANTDMARGFQVEVRKLATKNVAYSVSIIHEGDSGVTDRTGVAAQVWYVMPTADDKWTFSVGAGPYIAKDARNDGKAQLMAATSMEVARKITKTSKISLRFTRAISGNDKDQDMFFVGIQKKFK
jgi:hypothetical protein